MTEGSAEVAHEYLNDRTADTVRISAENKTKKMNKAEIRSKKETKEAAKTEK